MELDYHSDHFVTDRNIESLCCAPGINIEPEISCTSMKKKRKSVLFWPPLPMEALCPAGSPPRMDQVQYAMGFTCAFSASPSNNTTKKALQSRLTEQDTEELGAQVCTAEAWGSLGMNQAAEPEFLAMGYSWCWSTATRSVITLWSEKDYQEGFAEEVKRGVLGGQNHLCKDSNAVNSLWSARAGVQGSTRFLCWAIMIVIVSYKYENHTLIAWFESGQRIWVGISLKICKWPVSTWKMLSIIGHQEMQIKTTMMYPFTPAVPKDRL